MALTVSSGVSRTFPLSPLPSVPAAVAAWTAIALFSALSLSNCIVTVKDNAQTTGRQLIDLKEALHSGAITQAEYNRQKAAVLNPAH